MRSPHRSRERILSFAVGGCGKTHAAAQIATILDPGDTMYVIETDPSWDRMLEDPQFAELGVREAWRGDEADPTWDGYLSDDGNLVIYRCETWPEIRTALAEVWGRAKFHDWIIVDNITRPWEEIQSWYWQEVCGVEQDEFLLDLRRRQLKSGNEKGKPAEGMFNEWSYINPTYAKQFTRLILNPPCHLYLTAEQGEIIALYDERQKETWALYGALGAKPKSQKKAMHATHTVLHLSRSKTGEHRMTTVKDRGGREGYLREPWTDFVEDYLVAIGGWTASETDSQKEETWTTVNPPKLAATTTESPTAKPKPKAHPKPKP